MHEKILIPPAVHDEPHFAKKTLVLAVLLSATSMFATAASVNVVTGQTYQDDVDVKAPDTFTNAGTVKTRPSRWPAAPKPPSTIPASSRRER